MNECLNPNSACSDEELVRRTAQGDRMAEETLMLRYGRLVRVCARPLFLMGGDQEDLFQEGMVGLMQATREFDPSCGASFHTYAETCIRNRLRSAVRAASRNKHIPLNSSIPLEEPLFDGKDSPSPGELGQQANDPETLFIHREDMQERMDRIYQQLSPLESRILRQYLRGQSYAEIAEECGRPQKSVDNAIQRIRKKVARLIDHSENSI